MSEESPQESLPQKGLEHPAGEDVAGNTAAPPQSKYGVPERQWELPVGFCGCCKQPVTLRELVEHAPPLLPSDSLTDEQRTKLVTGRLLGQRKFSLSVYGVGVIDRERAVCEVEAGSKLGQSIARVEMTMIQEMIGLATGKGIPPKA
ncbi:MAG: hypothetical protein JOZ02_17560 [Acidobacteria bacterium]|nr:hypothetical protein [Acidobacteriota bacterium]